MNLMSVGVRLLAICFLQDSELSPTDISRGLEKLQSQHGRISGSYEFSFEDGIGKHMYVHDFAIDGESFRFSESMMQGGKPADVLVQGCNNKYAFRLTRVNRAEDQGAWQTSIVPVTDDQELQRFKYNAWRSDFFLRSAYAIQGVDLRPVFTSPTPKYKNPKRTAEGLWSMEISHAETNPPNRRTTTIHGTVVLDPERDWAIVRFEGDIEASGPGDMDRRGEILVKQSLKKFGDSYIVSQATIESPESPSGGRQVLRFTLLEANKEKPADTTFTLTGYGLPEPEIAQ